MPSWGDEKGGGGGGRGRQIQLRRRCGTHCYASLSNLPIVAISSRATGANRSVKSDPSRPYRHCHWAPAIIRLGTDASQEGQLGPALGQGQPSHSVSSLSHSQRHRDSGHFCRFAKHRLSAPRAEDSLPQVMATPCRGAIPHRQRQRQLSATSLPENLEISRPARHGALNNLTE